MPTNSSKSLKFTIRCVEPAHETVIEEKIMEAIVRSCFYQSKTAYKILKPFFEICKEEKDGYDTFRVQSSEGNCDKS